MSNSKQIRLFGDPRDNGSETPTLSISIKIDIEEVRTAIVRQPTHDIIPDFVDGNVFGEAVGVGIRSIGGWWSVESIETDKSLPVCSQKLIKLHLLRLLARAYKLRWWISK